MASLERFTNPLVRIFDENVRMLPGSRLYFYKAGTTTYKATYANKQGTTPNPNPLVADANGIFPPAFLQGLYRVELRSNKNIVQPGWPIDNVGQDSNVVPFGEWSEITTYPQYFPVTAENGNWYRSLVNDNLGNEPSANPSSWELITVPVASGFTSNVPYITFSDDGDQISVDFDIQGIEDNLNEINDDLNINGLCESNGARFGNSPIADLNTLDYYQEGTFTPASSGSASTGAATYTLQSGTYTRIGNRVLFDIEISWSAHTGIGPLLISGFPFNAVGSTIIQCIADGFIASGSSFARMVNGVSTIQIFALDGSTGNVSPVVIDPAGTISISGSCKVS